MKKKLRLPLRALGVILAVCLTMAMPTAYATTPEQESVLATGQRSINNPKGSFEIPEALPGSRLLHPDTRGAMGLAFQNFMQQLFLGNGEAEAFRRILAYTPIIKAGDELPPMVALGMDALAVVREKGISDMYFAFQETDTPGLYRIVGIHSANSGEKYGMTSGVMYNAATGLMYSEEGLGILGSGYEYSVDQEMLRTAPTGWNRFFGFNIFYDMVGPLLLFNLKTLRFPFVYQGRDFMIQMWKGFYTISNGAEIGLYEKDPGQRIHYEASDTMLEMSMKVYQGDKLYFDYGTQRTWWVGGFSYASPILRQLPPRKLRLTGTILFEDKAMLDAFLASFEKNKPANMSGGAEGLLFRFDWQTG